MKTIPIAGEPITFIFTVKNIGDNSAVKGRNFSVELRETDNDTPLAIVSGTKIPPKEARNIEIKWTPARHEVKNIYAKIAFADDEDPTNNETKPKSIYIQPIGTAIVHIGDPTMKVKETGMPTLYLTDQAAKFQTIYLEEEIKAKGIITYVGF
jgi:hypothetical protein